MGTYFPSFSHSYMFVHHFPICSYDFPMLHQAFPSSPSRGWSWSIRLNRGSSRKLQDAGILQADGGVQGLNQAGYLEIFGGSYKITIIYYVYCNMICIYIYTHIYIEQSQLCLYMCVVTYIYIYIYISLNIVYIICTTWWCALRLRHV